MKNTPNLIPNTSNLKVIFMGTPQIAADILADLIKDGVQFSSVITQPEKSTGRKNSNPQPVKELAKMNNIKVFQPIDKKELVNLIAEEKPDLCIVAAYGLIIPKEALLVPKYGMINFHPSLLPAYRGPSPIMTAILNGDKETGVTIIKMDEKMDEGNILAQEKIGLNQKEDNPALEKTLSRIGSRLIAELLRTLPESVQDGIKQDKNPSYCQMITKKDGEINWKEQTAVEIERMSRAYLPWPGVYSFWGDLKLDFYNISVTKGLALAPGEVYIQGKKILIGTKSGAITPREVKLEGKQKIPTEEFIRGYQKIKGAHLGSKQ